MDCETRLDAALLAVLGGGPFDAHAVGNRHVVARSYEVVAHFDDP